MTDPYNRYFDNYRSINVVHHYGFNKSIPCVETDINRQLSPSTHTLAMVTITKAPDCDWLSE